MFDSLRQKAKIGMMQKSDYPQVNVDAKELNHLINEYDRLRNKRILLTDNLNELELAYRTLRGNISNVGQSAFEAMDACSKTLAQFPVDPKDLFNVTSQTPNEE